MAVISSSLHSDTRGDAQTIEQTTPVGDAETAAWKLTWKLLTVGRRKKTPHTWHQICQVLNDLNDCVITHVGSLGWRDPVFYQVVSSIGGDHLRCEEDFRRESIKNIISQDHPGHKVGGQPSEDDWMSLHILGLLLASKIPLLGALYSRHRINLGANIW